MFHILMIWSAPALRVKNMSKFIPGLRLLTYLAITLLWSCTASDVMSLRECASIVLRDWDSRISHILISPSSPPETSSLVPSRCKWIFVIHALCSSHFLTRLNWILLNLVHFKSYQWLIPFFRIKTTIVYTNRSITKSSYNYVTINLITCNTCDTSQGFCRYILCYILKFHTKNIVSFPLPSRIVLVAHPKL